MKIELTEELARDIRENVFGSCTVVYEAMSDKEVIEDITNYLTSGAMTGAKVVRLLTLTTMREWLRFRLTLELIDCRSGDSV